MKRIFISILLSVIVLQLFAENEKIAVGKLESATILRIGAELVHTAKVPLSSGNNEVIIENLSASIDENSLQIKCSGGVTMMGSEFTADYLSDKQPSVAVKKLQDSIEYYNKEISKLNIALETNNGLRSLLQANKTIGGEQTGLKVDELVKMMDYYKTKSMELETEKNAIAEKTAKIKESLRSFNQQLEQEKTKNNNASGRLKLKLASPLSGNCDITVSYYTPAAYWIPYYDLQASGSDKPVKMICKAKFMQTTGLDWSKINLTLSTAVPSNGKTAPVFNSWFLNYVQEHVSIGYGRASRDMMVQNSISYKEVEESKLMEQMAPAPVGFANSQAPLYVLNGNVIDESEFKSINPQMIKDVQVLRDASSSQLYGSAAANGVVLITLKDNFVTESENQIDMSYKIDLPYDVLGTGIEQSVTLRSLDLPATFEFYSAPKLDKTVYLLAGIKDWAQYNLLPGEANITYDGTYSGKSYIDPLSTRDVLHLTLGNDKRIVVKREKMQDFSSTKFLGSDKEQVFTYQLTVKNTKNVPVDMILKDQYPISTDKTITVKVLETSDAHINTDIGTLTWEFPLKAGETRTFKLSYSVKYPKDKTLNL